MVDTLLKRRSDFKNRATHDTLLINDCITNNKGKGSFYFLFVFNIRTGFYFQYCNLFKKTLQKSVNFKKLIVDSKFSFLSKKHDEYNVYTRFVLVIVVKSDY